MRVIIAYDGSTFADAAIDDLPRAGFPHDTEVLVASVADFSAGGPVVSEFDLISAASRRIDTAVDQARQHEAHVLEEAQAMASKIVRRIQEEFPGWNVSPEILRGDPAEELLRKVSQWKADLIMGGSHGRSTIGRFFLGSVSKSVAEEAASSVRVVRHGHEKSGGGPVEIILGAKHPAEAERIAEAVGRRVWPTGTRIRMVVMDDDALAGSVPTTCPDGRSIYESAADQLSNVCLKVSLQITGGDPKEVLLEAADAWRADAIFVAAGRSRGLDETASGLVTGAKCTVEIVR